MIQNQFGAGLLDGTTREVCKCKQLIVKCEMFCFHKDFINFYLHHYFMSNSIRYLTARENWLLNDDISMSITGE